MPTAQEQYDEAMFAFSQGDYAATITSLEDLLAQDPNNFEAQLALGMAYCRAGDLDAALVEGHKAEAMRPRDQLAHTNLSLFYVKKGDKTKAEHHGLQSKIASWKDNLAPPGQAPAQEPELTMARPAAPPIKITGKFSYI